MAKDDAEMFEGDEEGAEGKEGAAGAKKGPFASAMLMQILKWVAIVLGGILFIVTVVVVTIKLMGVGNQENARTAESVDYEAKAPELDWFKGIEDLRGATNETGNTSRKTYVIKIALGYTLGDTATMNEIIGKQVQIQAMLNEWFAERDGDYLLAMKNRAEIKELIRAFINQGILEHPIKEVQFTNYQILNF